MNHTIRRRVLIGLAPLAAAMAFAGCASNATAENSTSTSQDTVSTGESSDTSAGTLETDGLLAAAVPGLPDREVMVSGSPRTVATVRRQARAAGALRVHTDAFLGY